MNKSLFASLIFPLFIGCGGIATVSVPASAITIAPKIITTTPGNTLNFSAAFVQTNADTPARVIWSVDEGGGGSVDSTGRYTAPPTPGTYHVVAINSLDPTKRDKATVTVQSSMISIAISPANASVRLDGALTFNAHVSGTVIPQPNTVSWSVVETGGGTIDASGRYTAPSTEGVFHIQATSVADISRRGTATVTVATVPVITVSISPATATIQTGATIPFLAVVTGTADSQSTDVAWSVEESGGGSIGSLGLYTAPANPGTFHVRATSRADTARYDTATVTVTQRPAIVVSVSPQSASMVPGDTTAFSATVTGTADNRVTWTIQESGGGSVDSAGLYTAPGTDGIFHVRATSVADPSSSATATLDVNRLNVLPAPRRTVWKPGVPNGVPQRTTICATLSPSGMDDTTLIQSALDGCPLHQVVRLTAGNYRITGQGIGITRSVVLRGTVDANGRPSAKLMKDPGTRSAVISVGSPTYGYTQPTNLQSDGIKGSYSVTLANLPTTPPLTAGEIVTVDQLTNPSLTQWSPRSPPGDESRGWFSRFDRPIGQIVEIESISGNTVTFSTPLHIDLLIAYSAQLARFSNINDGPVRPAVRLAGIEDLYVSGGEGHNAGGNIHLYNAAYSWVSNVESEGQFGTGVNFDATIRCTLQNSYIHDSRAPITPGGGAYGIGINVYASDNLIENNISWNHNRVFVMHASGGGNVIAYNYLDDGWIDYDEQYMETGLGASDMTTAHYELFEGNQAFNIDADSTYGNSIYVVYFRNQASGSRRGHVDARNRRAIGLQWGNYWHSFVGNVLGYSGMSPAPAQAFAYEASFPWADDPVGLWRLGYNPDAWTNPPDPQVLATTMRDGNFDFFTNQAQWEVGPRRLPDSLYLSARPDFFGNNSWPWVNPTGPTPINALPARNRFDSLHP